MSDTISLEGVSVESLRLTGEDCLVRPAPMEEKRASGLYVPNAAPEAFVGGVFYGEVVKVGPGRLVERAPSPERVADRVAQAVIEWSGLPDSVADSVLQFLRDNTTQVRVPMPWKPGDRVVCRQGHGPEVILREGTFHIIGRGNADYGHGIIAAWDAAHVHCWHRTGDGSAECACGERQAALETRLPSCAACPPGERLAEAVLGGEVYSAKHGNNVGPGFYEMRPEEDR